MKNSVKRLTFCAMLVAMSVVIAIFCKTYLNFANGLLRVTFENIPIILGGIMFGPIVGAVIGLSSDLVGYFLSPQVLAINPIVTLGAMSVGLISGLCARFLVKKRGYKQIIISSLASHIIGSMIIKTIGLYAFYGVAVLVRVPLYIIICGLEILLLCLLYKHTTIKRLLKYI